MDRLTQFSRDGAVFDVDDAGPLDGPVVVLLHGFPANRSSWRGVTPALNDAGFRTLAPDQRGYSPGARSRGRAAYRSAELVRDVLALVDASGAEKVHVVGHDWGGFVAWQLATVAPQRLERLTVVSTPHPKALQRSLLTSAQLLRSAYIGFFQLPEVPERVLPERMVDTLVASGLPRDVARDYARFMDEPGALTGGLNWYRGAWLPGGSRMDGGDRRVRVPTTYVWGSGDTALGRRAAELTADHVSAPYRFVELDENHWIPEVAPDALAREILADV
ncbi:alpha/beta fold hydrolase [Sanguibacter suaedae]|uniref:Alpha/beta fold hydrolase n=1 Tax=Sanguibacter suaedae TaxID=2795737 RepID=A0A934I9A4_9MICO|nr:alpha/beta fold hydrolase [Sanguibacter suaedae]MBI9113723.1 alpha/beta fold hydrolase [Sanguibacter suaedae]